jgi:DMSO/TMAO reductase YedYZ molybdopterin-dependent catalytic subunit
MSRLGRWAVLLAMATVFWAGELAAQTVSPVSSTLTVAGNVELPMSLTVGDLKRYPAHEIDYVPGRGEHKAAPGPTHRYTGCLLREVLAAAKPVERNPRELRKSYVVATAGDGYEVVFSWAELFLTSVGDSVYVVYERDGAPVPDDEGRIALIVTSDARPVRHVKWLKGLTLRVA